MIIPINYEYKPLKTIQKSFQDSSNDRPLGIRTRGTRGSRQRGRLGCLGRQALGTLARDLGDGSERGGKPRGKRDFSMKSSRNWLIIVSLIWISYIYSGISANIYTVYICSTLVGG